jgi:hypothetical protein
VVDRVSILSDPDIVKLFKTRFVPVAVDQHDHRRRKDAEGKFFASVLKQAGRGLNGYSQGFYIFTPSGKLLEFANTLSADEMKRMLARALKEFEPTGEVPRFQEGPKGSRFAYELPEGGLIIDVTSKVLGGYERGDRTDVIRRTALGRDHLWLRKDEAESLTRDELPEGVKVRLARFHLVDNTRGEPPLWRPDEIKELKLTLDRGRMAGFVHLETRAGDRGYQAQLLGFTQTKAHKLARFDMVSKGLFWGQGAFNGGAPKGKFPFAVAFTLAGRKGEVLEVPPGAARGNLKGYLGNGG